MAAAEEGLAAPEVRGVELGLVEASWRTGRRAPPSAGWRITRSRLGAQLSCAFYQVRASSLASLVCDGSGY